MELEKQKRIKSLLKLHEVPLNEYVFQGPKDKDEFNLLYTTLSQMQYYDDAFVEIRPIAYTSMFAVTVYRYSEVDIIKLVSQLGGELIEESITYSLVVNCNTYNYVRDGFKRMFIDTRTPDIDSKKTREIFDFLKNTHLIHSEKFEKNTHE